jgi:site-specific recombinase XerD
VASSRIRVTTAETLPYTARSRRTKWGEEPRAAEDSQRYPGLALNAAPAARPADPPRPFGDLSAAAPEELVDLVVAIGNGQDANARSHRRVGARRLLRELMAYDGATWQERWDNSRFDGPGAESVAVLGATRGKRHALVGVLKLLVAARVIQPSLIVFRMQQLLGYWPVFLRLQQDPDLDRFDAVLAERTDLRHQYRADAQRDLARALTTQGIALRHLTPENMLHYIAQSRDPAFHYSDAGRDRRRLNGAVAWQVLHTMHFPPGTPPTLRHLIYAGQRTVEELVDRYPIANREVRQVILDYIVRRQADNDYGYIEKLIQQLAGTFWSAIERINPGQKDLRISQEVYDQWRTEIQFTKRGAPRVTWPDLLLVVRGFYIDLHSWSIEAPEEWGRWVAPCPIRPQDIKGHGARRRESYERMAGRTRVRQPLLPALVAHVEERLAFHSGLLQAAGKVELGEELEFEGSRFRRTNSEHDRVLVRKDREATVRVHDLQTGRLIHVEVEERTAFWEWAVVAVLRHSGIRVEELVELTHLSIRQYQRPNGEVIALLVIAPSKTDRERVIPMSADLFHAVAQVLKRTLAGRRSLPVLSRYDEHERVWTPAMPFLFQRTTATLHAVLATASVVKMLRRSCERLGETNPAFAGVTFTPHDFRRLFATEVTNGGLPIHIGAALLGHLDVRTTQGYVAVFSEDVVQHYQQFLNNRRSLRPQVEYAAVTDEEWTEFEAHFDKRKVELGTCARPYGTPCQHEHACCRCPMLQVSPKMLPRLDELEQDLLLRLRQAEAEQWLGEIDGITTTLTFLRAKREDATRQLGRQPVELGWPGREPR